MAGAGSIVGIGAVIVLAAVVLGPGSQRPAAGPTSMSPTASTASATPDETTGQTLASTQDGLSLTARFDRTNVEPGGKVTIDVTIHNGRTTEITYFAPCPGAVEMNTTASLPLEPIGRTWTGIKADLKADALGKGNVGGDQSDNIPAAIYSVSCEPGITLLKLLPAQTIESTLSWTANLIEGVPAVPGDVSFTITLMGPEGYPAHFAGFTEGQFEYGLGVPVDKLLHVAGSVHVAGHAPKVLSKGQVIDAALADPQFEAWLATEPESTWTTVNISLRTGGIVPGEWTLEVVQGVGAENHYGFAFVDPFTGQVTLDLGRVLP
jgi:hypothetical protein